MPTLVLPLLPLPLVRAPPMVCSASFHPPRARANARALSTLRSLYSGGTQIPPRRPPPLPPLPRRSPNSTRPFSTSSPRTRAAALYFVLRRSAGRRSARRLSADKHTHAHAHSCRRRRRLRPVDLPVSSGLARSRCRCCSSSLANSS